MEEGVGMDRVDVLIVGASQAGLYAAERLAQQGLRVRVIDRRPDGVRPARRTLIVTPYLDERLGVVPKRSVLYQVDRMAVVSPNRKTVFDFRRADWVLERALWIEELTERAREAGAEVVLGNRFLGIEHEDGKVRVVLQRDGTVERLRVDHLVGADGVFSRVARAAGLRRPPCVRIVQAEVRLPRGWDRGEARVWLEPEVCRHFVWLVPEDGRRGVLGVIEDLDRDPMAVVRTYVERLGVEVLGFQGAKVAMYHPRLRPWTRVQGLPVYLVGDAAGQVKVTTVGGTVTGLRGAQALVRSIVEGVPYDKAVQDLDRELRIHWVIKRGLTRMDGRAYDRLVERVHGRVREVLEQYTRDEMASAFKEMLKGDLKFAAWALRYGFRHLFALGRVLWK